MNNKLQLIYIKYKSVVMEIKTDLNIINAIKDHFPSSFFSLSNSYDPITFQVFISDSGTDTEGEFHFVVNRSLNNASLECWMNIEKKRCILTNIVAKSQYDKNRLLCFFCSNLFEKLIEKEGFISFHCACVEKNGHVIAFVGERMSGKTTAEMMLLDKDYNLVSNDCALFKYNEKEQNIDVLGVIEDVYIREKSRFYDRVLKLCRDLSIPTYHAYDGGTQNQRLVLSHGDLARVNNVEWVGKGTLSAIVFPKYNPSAEIIETHRVIENIENNMEKNRIETGHESTDFLNFYFDGCNSAELLLVNFLNVPSFYCEYSCCTEDAFCSFISSIVGG